MTEILNGEPWANARIGKVADATTPTPIAANCRLDSFSIVATPFLLCECKSPQEFEQESILNLFSTSKS